MQLGCVSSRNHFFPFFRSETFTFLKEHKRHLSEFFRESTLTYFLQTHTYQQHKNQENNDDVNNNQHHYNTFIKVQITTSPHSRSSEHLERKAPTFFPTFKQLDNLKNDSNMIRTSAEKQQIS